MCTHEGGAPEDCNHQWRQRSSESGEKVLSSRLYDSITLLHISKRERTPTEQPRPHHRTKDEDHHELYSKVQQTRLGANQNLHQEHYRNIPANFGLSTENK